MKLSVMAYTIVISLFLTVLIVLSIGYLSEVPITEEQALTNAINMAFEAEKDEDEIKEDLINYYLAETSKRGDVEIIFHTIDAENGLLDVEVIKTYYWMGVKKEVNCRRVVIIEAPGELPEILSTEPIYWNKGIPFYESVTIDPYARYINETYVEMMANLKDGPNGTYLAVKDGDFMFYVANDDEATRAYPVDAGLLVLTTEFAEDNYVVYPVSKWLQDAELYNKLLTTFSKEGFAEKWSFEESNINDIKTGGFSYEYYFNQGHCEF